MPQIVEDPRWQAVLARDGASDGKFVFAVSSTGVYCRPSCPSKRPRRENVTFFGMPQEAEKAGFRACLRCRPKAVSGNPRQEMIKAVCRYIEQHLDEPIKLGMEPAKYRRGAIAAPIRYTCADSPLGRILVAATDKGICCIQFAESDEELEQGLKQEFPFALRRRDDAALSELAQKVMRQMKGLESASSLPLDIQATAFQRRVWTYLQSISFGETRSYSEVAKSIRQPSAVRAVARACATNPVAIAIPCHRIVRSDGDLGGYRWGIQRKKALLEMEASRRNQVANPG